MKITPDRDALEIIHRLREGGHEAYFCGGCVRDLLLGNQPPKDWDITTSATPEEVAAIFDRTVPVGKAFGVMVVVTNAGQYEVATFRTDSPTGDGRRPESVVFSTAEEDVKRRDFTINGLLYDPDNDKIIDHVGGREDLNAGIIRAIGEPRRRIMEDYLRMLRAVRFSARLEFALDEDLQNVITGHAGLVRLLSAERVGMELETMLTGAHADRALYLLDSTNLLVHILPEVAAMKGTPQPPEFHPEGDVFRHTALMLAELEQPIEPSLAWAVLLHDVGKPETISFRERIRFDNHPAVGMRRAENILRRLKRPNRTVGETCELIRDHMRLTHLREMRVAKRRHILRNPLFGLHLELHRLDCECSHRKLDIYDYACTAWEEEKAIPEPPELLLSGEDLIEMGFEPGPEFGRILAELMDAQLEGEVVSRAAAEGFVRQAFGA